MMTAAAGGTAEIRRFVFGRLPDGRDVPAVMLSSPHGLSATIIAYGATLQSLKMPDRAGQITDVTLGYSAIEDYLRQPQFFGATIGRVANRIAQGRFTLDGKTYQTPVNDGVNALHGGNTGFDKVMWDIVAAEAAARMASVTLRYVSADGEQGYPGKLTVDATYRLDEGNVLSIVYRAKSDRPTVVNITNHAYWNLAGEGDMRGAMAHMLSIPADCYLPVDATLIPTGEVRCVDGSVFDFRTPTAIGDRVRDAADRQIALGRGYDHNWVAGFAITRDPRLMACVTDPSSGRGFELWSNQPGLQFYSGNFLDGTSFGKSKKLYRQGDGFCLEPQTFPNTVNQPEFGTARLDPGQEYVNLIEYRFTTGASRRSRAMRA